MKVERRVLATHETEEVATTVAIVVAATEATTTIVHTAGAEQLKTRSIEAEH